MSIIHSTRRIDGVGVTTHDDEHGARGTILVALPAVCVDINPAGEDIRALVHLEPAIAASLRDGLIEHFRSATEDEGPSERRVDLIESITADEWFVIVRAVTTSATILGDLQRRLRDIERLTRHVEDEAPR